MKKLCAVIILLSVAWLAYAALAQRRNTMSGRLKPVPAAVSQVFDSVPAAHGDLTFSGYDKRLRSARETMFVTNNTGTDICQIIFHIDYSDMQGRQLHRRRCVCRLDLPAGGTRCVDIPTWDRQGSFYFHGSRRSRNPGVPYAIKISPDTIISLR